MALMVAITTSACSFGIKRLQDPYDPRTQPRCEPEELAAFGDLAVGTLFTAAGSVVLAAILVGAGKNNNVSENDRATGGGMLLATGLAWGGLGLFGRHWNRECSRAIAQWDKRQIDQDRHLEEPQATPKKEAQPKHVATPRGFYCTSNATVGTCSREKTACETARDALLGAAADLSECTLVEKVWCVGKRCAPTEAMCGDACEEAD